MKQKSLLLVLALGLVSIWPLVVSARQVEVSDGAQDPAVSPDGRRIAVCVLGKIWVMDASGGAAQQISQGIGWDSHPAWSPDGQFLAYSHQLASGSELVSVNLATGIARQIWHTDQQIQQVGYAPDGGQLFFVQQRDQYNAHVYRLPVGGGKPQLVSTEAEGWHEWSFAIRPDGKLLYVDSGRYGGSNLYAIELDTLKPSRLTNTDLDQRNVIVAGDELGFVETQNGVQSVMLQPPGGGAARKAYSTAYAGLQIAAYPDGRHLLLCSRRKLVRLDTTNGRTAPIPFVAKFILPDQSPGDLIVTNARLFDGTGKVTTDATVVIRDGRITSVTSGGAGPAAGDVRVVDAAGKTVLPGLMDNHYHFWNVFDGEGLLERGVTAIRDPGAPLQLSLNFKEAIALGLFAGPDIYTAGPIIDGLHGYHPMVDVELTDASAAAALVRSFKQQGVDAIKAYFQLKPEIVAAVIREAHAQGLRVTGHIGVLTSWSQAMDFGIDGFNHIRVWHDFLPESEQPTGANESLDNRYPIARMQADWTEIDPDSSRVSALLDKMKAHHIGYDPTLTVQDSREWAQKYLSLGDHALSLESFARMSRFTRRVQEEGVLLLAGTDNTHKGDLRFELEDYAAAGIPPSEILKAATANGAEWLGKMSDFGTVQPGRRGDLVIVAGDPTIDVKALRNIEMVIKDGRIVFTTMQAAGLRLP